ncbi:MAG: hypothetical protein AAGU11_02730 [Syntrophobacteraceae bacterium]
MGEGFKLYVHKSPRCDAMEGSFFFDPDDPIYAEHFPGNPVVPGSMIIEAFMLAAFSTGQAPARAVRDFRFKRFVSPGEYRYRLEAAGTDLRCRLFDGDTVVATGVIAR